MNIEANGSQGHQSSGIPMPIVNLNRWMLLAGIVLALVSGQAWITTLLFFILLAALLYGPRGSLVMYAGKKLFSAQKLDRAEKEDKKLMRFNNAIAVGLLGAAQLAFGFGASLLGWTFALMVAIAAGIALAGFCVGCFLYFQFRMYRYRLFGK